MLDSKAWVNAVIDLLKSHFAGADVYFVPPVYSDRIVYPIAVIHTPVDDFVGDGRRLTRTFDVDYIVDRRKSLGATSLIDAYALASDFMNHLSQRPAPSDAFVLGSPLTLESFDAPLQNEAEAHLYQLTITLSQELAYG